MLLHTPEYSMNSWGNKQEEFYEWLQCKIAQNSSEACLHPDDEQYYVKKEKTYQRIIDHLWEDPKIKNWVKNNLWTADH